MSNGRNREEEILFPRQSVKGEHCLNYTPGGRLASNG
jgi:hypothetical protein